MPWIPDASTAIHTDENEEFQAVAEKTTPVDEDLIVIEDSEDLYAKKHVQLGNLPGGGGGATELDDLDDVDLTGLADGDFLQYDSGSGLWLPVDAPGGGSSGVEFIDYLAGRLGSETPHTDDKFFTSSLGGTQVAVTGTAVWTVAKQMASVKFGNQTAGDVAGVLYALTSPSAPMTFETAVQILHRSENFQAVGLMVADGTASTDDVALIRINFDNTIFRSAGTLTNYTATNTSPFTVVPRSLAIYFRLVWKGSNSFEVQVSPDGISWFDAGDLTPTLTPTHAGFFVSSQGGANNSVAAFHYLRVYNSDLSI